MESGSWRISTIVFEQTRDYQDWLDQTPQTREWFPTAWKVEIWDAWPGYLCVHLWRLSSASVLYIFKARPLTLVKVFDPTPERKFVFEKGSFRIDHGPKFWINALSVLVDASCTLIYLPTTEQGYILEKWSLISWRDSTRFAAFNFQPNQRRVLRFYDVLPKEEMCISLTAATSSEGATMVVAQEWLLSALPYEEQCFSPYGERPFGNDYMDTSLWKPQYDGFWNEDGNFCWTTTCVTPKICFILETNPPRVFGAIVRNWDRCNAPTQMYRRALRAICDREPTIAMKDHFFGKIGPDLGVFRQGDTVFVLDASADVVARVSPLDFSTGEPDELGAHPFEHFYLNVTTCGWIVCGKLRRPPLRDTLYRIRLPSHRLYDATLEVVRRPLQQPNGEKTILIDSLLLSADTLVDLKTRNTLGTVRATDSEPRQLGS